MAEDNLPLALHMSEDGAPTASLGAHEISALAELNGLGLDLNDPTTLTLYCEAANHLSRGYQYRIIEDADAYRADYDARFAAEDPQAPWQQGVPRLHDFGRSDTSSITSARQEADGVVAFAEHLYLRIPYRAFFPTSAVTADDVDYEPLPMMAAEADE